MGRALLLKGGQPHPPPSSVRGACPYLTLNPINPPSAWVRELILVLQPRKPAPPVLKNQMHPNAVPDKVPALTFEGTMT